MAIIARSISCSDSINIQEVLAACENNISRAAEKMGISRRQLFNKITEYEIDTKK